MRSSRGFSLVELSVVVAILGLLLAVGFPSFQTWLRSVQVRNAAESLQNGLQFARMEALRRNERVSFWMVSSASVKLLDNSCLRSAAGASWVVSRDNPASACGEDYSETMAPRIIQKKAGGEGSPEVVVGAVDTGGAPTSCITFNGFGRIETTCADAAVSQPLARIAFASTQADAGVRNLEVRVSPGGLIRMCDPAVTVSTDPRAC